MDVEIEKSLREVCRAADKLGIKIVLVGGLFSEFTNEIGPKDPPFPKTNDADFAVYVRDWASFDRLKNVLIESGFQQQFNIEHRLRREATIVDLMPYGSQIAPQGKIVWPQSGMEFIVTGFEEACAAADLSTNPGGPGIPVVTMAGFLLLKIIAYLDRKSRGEQKYKGDAAHIDYCLRNYGSEEGDLRRFELSSAVGPDKQDYDTAGAVLLGIEIRKLASPESSAYVERFIGESKDQFSPYADALVAGRFDSQDEKRAEAARLIAAFRKGYTLKDSWKKSAPAHPDAETPNP